MAEIFEVMMVLSFGFSWPMSIMKSYNARTAKGKSLFFLCLILSGYACGIASKLLGGRINYVIVFYILNFVMVGIDLLLYFRNSKLDLEAGRDLEAVEA
ncbi:hypothetical protein [Anaerotalea alkaliphila]|uniref:PQ loop repeat protein n=1 Tax=Anaerotalea alkaliphila TaxID=2662126 RepID=A0A7X5KNZ7_9FIRM|nr:hypothetical protein [Anaerotalea alkaliphila]NDL68474.1 hypothetical protein [Anaerotalea alkaliphila]